jgi:hypothetical protein
MVFTQIGCYSMPHTLHCTVFGRIERQISFVVLIIECDFETLYYERQKYVALEQRACDLAVF